MKDKTPAEKFTVTVLTKSDDSITYELDGRIDSITSNKLSIRLDEAVSDGRVNIVLDMCGVSFLSSAGIRVILYIYKQTKELGGSLQVINPSDNVKNVLGMTAIDQLVLDK